LAVIVLDYPDSLICLSYLWDLISVDNFSKAENTLVRNGHWFNTKIYGIRWLYVNKSFCVGSKGVNMYNTFIYSPETLKF